jgi:hypothetical protein
VSDDVVIEIEESEWQEVSRRLANALGGDERHPSGHFLLVISGGRRRWVAADSVRLFVLDTVADDRDITLLVSPRLLEAWPMAAAGTGRAELRVATMDGELKIAISGSGGSLVLDQRPPGDLAVDAVLAEQMDRPRREFRLEAEPLVQMTHLARRAPSGLLADDQFVDPLMWVFGGADEVAVCVFWDGLGVTRYATPASGDGDGMVSVSPIFLTDLVDALEPGELVLGIPDDSDNAIIVRQGMFTALLMPTDVDETVRSDVEAILAELYGDEVVRPDSDGDYLLTSRGVPVYARIVPTDELTQLQIFAVVLSDVAEDPELLAELNQLNRSSLIVKLIHTEEAVIVGGSLVADTLDGEEVETLVNRVREVADEVAPMLEIRFGGNTIERMEHQRWANYVRTVVTAELDPGVWSRLTGDDALERLPFEAPVYVITACDPFGRTRSDDENRLANARLAADLTHLGAGFLRALGSSGDGAHAEPSFLVWGVTLDDVMGLAAAYEQEAVFELTNDTVSVIGVFGDERTDRPRRGALPT